MKTPEQIADEIALPRVISSGNTLKQLMVAAIEADRAQRQENPLPFQEVIDGVFVNTAGDRLIEPLGVEAGELVLLNADGTTATLRGEWETGFTA